MNFRNKKLITENKNENKDQKRIKDIKMIE